jgi:hypothetical protein
METVTIGIIMRLQGPFSHEHVEVIFGILVPFINRFIYFDGMWRIILAGLSTKE